MTTELLQLMSTVHVSDESAYCLVYMALNCGKNEVEAPIRGRAIKRNLKALGCKVDKIGMCENHFTKYKISW